MLSRLRLPTNRVWNCTIALRDHVKNILKTSIGQRSIAASWTIANLRKISKVSKNLKLVRDTHVGEKIGDCFISGGPRTLILLPNNTEHADSAEDKQATVVVPHSLSAHSEILDINKDEIEYRIEDFTNLQDPYLKATLYQELHEETEDENYDTSGPITWNIIN